MSPGLLGPSEGAPVGGGGSQEQQGGRWAPVRKMSRRTTGDPVAPALARGSASAQTGAGGATGVPGAGGRGAARRPVGGSGRLWGDMGDDVTPSSGPLVYQGFSRGPDAGEGDTDWAGAWPQKMGHSGPLAVPPRLASEASPPDQGQRQGQGQGGGEYDTKSELERQRSFWQPGAQVPIMRSRTDGELRLRARRGGGAAGAANARRRSPVEPQPASESSGRGPPQGGGAALGPRVYPRRAEGLPQARPSGEGLVGHSSSGGWGHDAGPVGAPESRAQQPRQAAGGAARGLGLRVEVGGGVGERGEEEEDDNNDEWGAWIDNPGPMRKSESFARPIHRPMHSTQAPAKQLPGRGLPGGNEEEEGDDEGWVDDPRPARRSECFAPSTSKQTGKKTPKGLSKERGPPQASGRCTPTERTQTGSGQDPPVSHSTVTPKTPNSTSGGSGSGAAGKSFRAWGAGQGSSGHSGSNAAAAMLSSLVRQWTTSKPREGEVPGAHCRGPGDEGRKKSSPSPESGSGSGSGTPGVYSRASTLKSRSQREQEKGAYGTQEEGGEEVGEEEDEEEWINDYRSSHSAPFPSQRRKSSSRAREAEKGTPRLSSSQQQGGKPGKVQAQAKGGPSPATPKRSPLVPSLSEALLGALTFSGGRVVGAGGGRTGGSSKNQGSSSGGGKSVAGSGPRVTLSTTSQGARELAQGLAAGGGGAGAAAAHRRQSKGDEARAAAPLAAQAQAQEERGERRGMNGARDPKKGSSLAAELQEKEELEGPSPAGAMTRACPEPVLVLGVWTGLVVAANPAALAALGFADEEEARKCTLFELAEGLQQATWQELMSALMTGETGRTTLQVRLLKSACPGHSGPLSGSWVLADMHLSGSGLDAELVALLSRLEAPPMLAGPFGSRRASGNGGNGGAPEAPADAGGRSGRFSPRAAQKLSASQDVFEDPELVVYQGAARGSAGDLSWGNTGEPEGETQGGAGSQAAASVSPFGGMPQVYLSRSLEPEGGAPVKLATPERTNSGTPMMHRSQSYSAKWGATGEGASPEAPLSMGVKSRTCPRSGALQDHQPEGSGTPTESSPGGSQGSAQGVPRAGLPSSPSSREEEEAPTLAVPMPNRRVPGQGSRVSPRMPTRAKSLAPGGASASNRYRSLRRGADDQSPTGQHQQHQQKTPQQQQQPPRVSLKVPDASFPLAAISPRLQAVVQATSFGVPFQDTPRHTASSASPGPFSPPQSQTKRNPKPPAQPRKPAESNAFSAGPAQAHAQAQAGGKREGRLPVHHSGPHYVHQAGAQRAHHSGPVYAPNNRGPQPVYHSGPLAGEGRGQRKEQGWQQGGGHAGGKGEGAGVGEGVPVQRIRSFGDWQRGEAPPAAHPGPTKELDAGSGTPLAGLPGLPPGPHKVPAQGPAGSKEGQRQAGRHTRQLPGANQAQPGPTGTPKAYPGSASTTVGAARHMLQKSNSEAADPRRFMRRADGAPVATQGMEGGPWHHKGEEEGDDPLPFPWGSLSGSLLSDPMDGLPLAGMSEDASLAGGPPGLFPRSTAQLGSLNSARAPRAAPLAPVLEQDAPWRTPRGPASDGALPLQFQDLAGYGEYAPVHQVHADGFHQGDPDRPDRPLVSPPYRVYQGHTVAAGGTPEASLELWESGGLAGGSPGRGPRRSLAGSGRGGAGDGGSERLSMGESRGSAVGRGHGAIDRGSEEGGVDGWEAGEGEAGEGRAGTLEQEEEGAREEVLTHVGPLPIGLPAARPLATAARPVPPALASIIHSLLPDSDTSMDPQHGSQDWTSEPHPLWHPPGVPGVAQGGVGEGQQSVDWSEESSEDEEGEGAVGKRRGAPSEGLSNGKRLDTRTLVIDVSASPVRRRDTGSGAESPGEGRAAEGAPEAHPMPGAQDDPGTPDSDGSSAYNPSIAATEGAAGTGTPPGHRSGGSAGTSLGSEEPWAGAYQPWPSNKQEPGQVQGPSPGVPGDYQRIEHGKGSVDSVEYEPLEGAGSPSTLEDAVRASTGTPTARQEEEGAPRRASEARGRNASATSGSSSDASLAFSIPVAHPFQGGAPPQLSPAGSTSGAPGAGGAPAQLGQFSEVSGAPEEDGEESLESPQGGVLWAHPVEESPEMPSDALRNVRRSLENAAPGAPPLSYQGGPAGLPAAGDGAGAAMYQRSTELGREQAAAAAPSSSILESWFSNLLTAAGFGFVLFDGLRLVTLCSRHFAANLGFADPEDAVGTPLRDIMAKESLEDLETLLTKPQEAHSKRLVSFKHRDGRTVGALISAHPDYPLAHKVTGEVGALVEFL